MKHAIPNEIVSRNEKEIQNYHTFELEYAVKIYIGVTVCTKVCVTVCTKVWVQNPTKGITKWQKKCQLKWSHTVGLNIQTYIYKI